MSQKMQAAFSAVEAAADPAHAATHETMANAMAAAAPAQAQASINDLISRARALNIPWGKIFAAIMIAAAGGFSPAAIAAAVASLFGTPATP